MLNLGAPGYAESLTIRGGGGDMVLLSPLVSLSGAAVLNVYDGAALRDTLSRSTPGGVQLSGTAELNMHGGVIENCNNSLSVAGGVVVDGAAVFRLCGGTIRGCTGYGGAVAIGGQGRMEFSAGLIENCESLDCGGAILLVSTAFTGAVVDIPGPHWLYLPCLSDELRADGICRRVCPPAHAADLENTGALSHRRGGLVCRQLLRRASHHR